jgi:hypothetical protein
LAKQLRRKRPEGGQRSYAQISAELFAAGHANSRGRPFSASSIASMLSLGNPRSEEYVPIARAALVAAADARAEALRPVLAELVGRPFVAAAAELDRRGHPTASGKPWSAASVRNAMLRLGLYQPLLKKGASGTKPRKRVAE